MSLFHFFYDHFPPPALISWLFPLSLLVAYLSLTVAGLLKMEAGWRTGLTRKVFHFLIFFYVFALQQRYGLPGTFIAGWAVTVVLAFAIRRGAGCLQYEAIAREQDAPHRSRYIVYSYLATFGGGVLANMLMGGPFALFGYLITGIGDAVAEPVGVLFGKHKYRVLNFNRPLSYRSFEGSAAVFIATVFVLSAYAFFFPGVLNVEVHTLLGCALICTLLEAWSPQGWDNLLLQVGGSVAVYTLLG